MNNQTLEFKNKTKIIVENFIEKLEDINELSLDNVSDEKLVQSFENIRSIIYEGISKIKKNVEVLIKIAEWDKLNISFFGETNAGKSTILEALINGNGISIGEGYKDFTKKVNQVSYSNVNLMDMPGIEGREYKVIKNIKKAVRKSHIVLYVIGTNKEPEEETIKKIKGFLKDNMKVYTIINVRGRPSMYKYKKELVDDDICLVEKRIKDKFRKILGNNYAENIIINGHLALLRNKKILGTRFENDQIKAIEIFGNQEKIEEFSNINQIEKLIENLSVDINEEIKISNTYKFLKSFGNILSKILKEKKDFDVLIREIQNLINKYLMDIDKIIEKYESEINLHLEKSINNIKVDLKKVINESIDNNYSESKIKATLNEIKAKKSNDLNVGIKKILTEMKSEIEGKIKEFETRINLQMKFINLKGDFNIGSILESLRIDFKYILGQIVDIGFSIWGIIVAFAVNPIVGIIAGVFAIARKFWDWLVGDSDKRKRDAKKEAVREIDKTILKMHRKVKEDMEREFKQINANTKKPAILLKRSMQATKNISISLDSQISEIKKSQNELSLLLVKEFLGEEVSFAYLDLQLSEAVIIGYEVNDEVKEHIKRKFRLEKVSLYSSYFEWLNNAGKHCDKIFTANSEFNFRAIKVKILYDKEGINIKKVKRERKNI